ncbi:MAG: DUF1538 domain-containing protein, partial [Ruminococcus sp.]|nr:DUF1538 domain-containing protein [Ruminococcus sp.]
MKRHNIIKEKMKESVSSVLPIACIVLVLCLFVVPISSGLVLSFLIGTAMIIVGMCLFTIGADLSMTQIGSHIGAKMTNTRKLWFIMLLSFVLGIVITVAEPDLQVLAANVPEIDTKVLVATVSVGVGFFLMVSMLRILFGIPMKWLLLGLYGIVFLLAYLSDENFLSVAFDSGGVTTGPMTVPFIMSMGVGVASIRSDEKAKSDSFGLIALCSIGPILAVLILGFIYNNNTSEASAMLVNEFAVSVDIGKGYLAAFPDYFYEVVVALFPIFVFFLIFQIFSLKLEKRPFKKIVVGIVFTYIGLVLFLTGVNVGFSSLGYVLGGALVEKNMTWMIVPLAMVMGWFIINAEPAVHVLNKQVAELSAGAISEKTMGRTLSIAVSIAMGIAMIRVLTGIPIIWFVLIGYIIALLLAFFVPATFTAIAFDAGGVASGPMAATFMLPFAMGICNVIGGNVMTDAF